MVVAKWNGYGQKHLAADGPLWHHRCTSGGPFTQWMRCRTRVPNKVERKAKSAARSLGSVLLVTAWLPSDSTVPLCLLGPTMLRRWAWLLRSPVPSMLCDDQKTSERLWGALSSLSLLLPRVLTAEELLVSLFCRLPQQWWHSDRALVVDLPRHWSPCGWMVWSFWRPPPP